MFYMMLMLTIKVIKYVSSKITINLTFLTNQNRSCNHTALHHHPA